jgi:HSP20 family molecular chaperone IbpA
MSGGSVVPAFDLFQTEVEVVVKAALPGLKSEDVHISVTADVLTLYGEFKQENGKKEATIPSANTAMVLSRVRSCCRPTCRPTRPGRISRTVF